ncbi:type II CRISPR RNA-guided endonuclease Cas9 [Terrisporobacter vanillatitrophus]|uniref:type II CRISPR RNA-guided endonuclease Cas9 n=1 Tax=Terrisporobacter vanillatitrophus TaxID=3058402 RepID=UPI0033668896
MGNYNIGLDIGTHSVGWAVTDDNYNILKFKKKNMWGVRLFDEGETAENRRINRSTRRRLNRRRERIALLQQLLGKEIEKVDKAFFIRLKESFLYLEDRKDKVSKSNLFVGKEFSDKEYYDKYPTIYHLRKELIESPEKKDVRLVYLALHHIIKYRGNFLYEGQTFDNITGNIEETIQELIDEVYRLEIADIKLNPVEIKEIISNKDNSRQKKVDKLVNGEKIYKNQLKNIFNGLVGLKVDLSKIFTEIVFEEEINFKFSDEDIDTKLDKGRSVLGDDCTLLEIMEKIYSWSVMGNILNEQEYISFAKVEGYKKYKKELKMLKDLISHYDRKLYKEIFKSKEEEVNYPTYIKNKDKKLKNNDIKTVQGKFYDTVKGFIENKLEDGYLIDEKKSILKEIENDNFLITQTTKDNAAIPYQLNEMELIKILENQGKHYPCIEENKDKILRLLNFRVPYYVGPLNTHSNFAWVEKIKGMENEKIYPWNMDKIVDIDASAEEFIKRMTNKCTYLTNKDVLPRNSLLFADYMYYNEINKIKINNKNLDNKLKEDLREKVFLQKNTVSEKDIATWYKNNHQMSSGECNVTGLQGDKKAASSLKPYRDFIEVFEEINPSNRQIIENIIEWLTVFEDKKIVERKIEKEYPQIAQDKEMMKKILKLKYKGWARLSRTLLNGIYIVNSYQRKMTIIDILKEKDLNFMQIINNKEFGFDKIIKEENKLEDNTKITYDNLIKDLQGSPKIKRGVWQSIKIIEEIVKIMGTYPKNIFIEFAREDEESKRTSSRKSKLEKLYADLGEEYDEYINEDARKELKDKKTVIDTKVKLLYFMQLGKSMYSRKPLKFDQLRSYEIDHIIYQSLIKDDSIDNLVLVTKEENQMRSNQTMPVNFVSDDTKLWWGLLKEKGLMSSKKYNNLMKGQLNRYEEQGFLNRQLVETRQISKHVTNILINCYEKEGTKVVPVKASLVDDFRKQFDIYKNREINDYHHAKDALVTSVIGNYILNKFPGLEKEFVYNEYKKYSKYEDNRVNKYGFIIGSMNKTYEKDGKLVWEENKTIDKIKKQLNYKDCNITKRVCENKGELFNGTIYKKASYDESVDNKIPIKKNMDVKKYGYYKNEQTAYSSIIQYKNKGKIVKELRKVPVRFSNQIGDSKEKLKEYFEEVEKLEDVKILKFKVLKYQLFKNDKGIFYLASTRYKLCKNKEGIISFKPESEWHNAKQLLLESDSEEIIYKMSNKKYIKSITQEQLIEVFDKIIEKIDLHYLIYKNLIKKIKIKRDKFIELNIEEKVEIIQELLKLTKANAEKANMSLIKESKEFGKLNGKTMNIEETTFIYPSITGLYVREERY